MRGNVEQFNGREGETATFLSTLSVTFRRAWWRFRPTSSQALDASSLKTQAMVNLKIKRTHSAFRAKLRVGKRRGEIKHASNNS
ncbi:MAG: hypothetical protein M3367_08165 [Acidobacteriota bacterium]|nr:hypothetical protein [Acidobacteriota bacterium]